MSADANVFRWAIRRFHSKTELGAGALDARYFAESEFVSTSAGAGDAGKPVKLNGSGQVDATMLAGGSVATHAALTAAHGATGAVVGTTNTQTLTNKTLTAPVFTGPIIDEAVNPALSYKLSGVIKYGLYYNSGSTYFAIGETGVADHFVIKNGGNVGIGTTTPGYKLEVSGTLNATGAITQAGVAVVTTTGTQTLTNKTLTAPVISSISNTGTLTLPTSTDTLVGRATTDTLTNKTLTTPTISSTGFTNAQHAHTGASSGGQLDHGAAMTGLSDDDHTQYALLAGRSGGQTLYGGNAANEDLTIHGTNNATRTTSYVIIQPSGGQTIVGASSPLVTHPFEVQANNYAITLNPGFGSATNYVSSYTSGSPAPLALYGSRVFVDGDTIGVGTSRTPTGSGTGTAGMITWDTSYIYVCTATNTWKRAALSSF